MTTTDFIFMSLMRIDSLSRDTTLSDLFARDFESTPFEKEFGLQESKQEVVCLYKSLR